MSTLDLIQYGRSGSSSSYDMTGWVILIVLVVVIVLTVTAIALHRRGKKPSQQTQSIVTLCPFCGAKNNLETYYCGNCGQAINPNPKPFVSNS